MRPVHRTNLFQQARAQRNPAGPLPFFSEISLADARKIVEAHHYSHHIPTSVQVSLGMIDPLGEVLCAAVFRTPPTRWREPLIELGRLVRIPDYHDPLTAFLSKAFKYLAAHNHHLMVSFADSTHDHHGGIYQAASLNYGGQRKASNDGLIIDGTFVAGRACNHKWGTRSAIKLAAILPDAKIEAHFDKGKYLYWKALSRVGQKMAERLELQKLPYPKPASFLA